ncbi:MAG: T9SS type A sorting domain-containing protein [Bacteroidetes bacterium]|nr:T9SS type A sorting domain-containing protein [Bacteroidota bacterium]
MKKTLQIFTKITFAVLAFLGFVNRANAQCLAGEVAVSFDVVTDAYGYELYWELVPTGNACGVGTIFAGGNTAVGCGGGGLQAQAPGGYANNTTVTEGPFCLTIGSQYDIIMVDDWGDGGNCVNNVNQSVNACMGGSASNLTVTFTALAPPTGPDLVMTTTQPEYTIYPLSQVANIVSAGNIANIGALDATNTKMYVAVYQLPSTLVYMDSSTASTVAVSANTNFTVAGYTPTVVGNYWVEYISSTDAGDANAANDTAGYLVQVDDSTYARDYANVDGVTGLLGIGAGGGQNARLGQTFNLLNTDTLTSVDIYIGNGGGDLAGQPLQVHIYATAAGVPTTLLGSTDPFTMDTTTNTLWNLPISNGLVLPAGMFAVAVEENDSNITIGNTTKVFTNNAIYVKWDGNAGGAWTTVETFGAGFSKPFVLRPNFGVPPLPTGISEVANTNFTIYPNPATENILVNNVVKGSSLEVVNTLGQVVYSEVINNTKSNVNVANFNNGLYMIRITNGNEVITNTFVKQ